MCVSSKLWGFDGFKTVRPDLDGFKTVRPDRMGLRR